MAYTNNKRGWVNTFNWATSLAAGGWGTLNYFAPTQGQECTTETAEKTSAIAFAYAKMLQDSLQIPIGIIVNAIGGSPIEALWWLRNLKKLGVNA